MPTPQTLRWLLVCPVCLCAALSQWVMLQVSSNSLLIIRPFPHFSCTGPLWSMKSLWCTLAPFLKTPDVSAPLLWASALNEISMCRPNISLLHVASPWGGWMHLKLDAGHCFSFNKDKVQFLKGRLGEYMPHACTSSGGAHVCTLFGSQCLLCQGKPS